jgi:hypothetical protein
MADHKTPEDRESFAAGSKKPISAAAVGEPTYSKLVETRLRKDRKDRKDKPPFCEVLAAACGTGLQWEV